MFSIRKTLYDIYKNEVNVSRSAFWKKKKERLISPFSLFFFLFSATKMIRKSKSASTRIPITGHNGPRGSRSNINT